eukprot:162161_1
MTRISRPPNAYGDTQSFFFQISDNIINEISENNLGNINYNIQSFEIFQLNEYEHIRHKVDRILYQLVKDIGNYSDDCVRCNDILKRFRKCLYKILPEYYDTAEYNILEKNALDRNDATEYNIDSLLIFSSAKTLFNIIFVDNGNSDNKVVRDRNLIRFIVDKLHGYISSKSINIVNDKIRDTDKYRQKYRNDTKIYRRQHLRNYKLNKINLVQNDIICDPQSKLEYLMSVFKSIYCMMCCEDILKVIVEYELGDFDKYYTKYDDQLFLSNRRKSQSSYRLTQKFKVVNFKEKFNETTVIHIMFPNKYEYVLELIFNLKEKTYKLYDEIKRLLNDDILQFKLILLPNILIKEKHKQKNEMESKTFKEMVMYPKCNVRFISDCSDKYNAFIKHEFIKQYLTDNVALTQIKYETKEISMKQRKIDNLRQKKKLMAQKKKLMALKKKYGI